MLRITPAMAKPGMVLAAPIIHPKRAGTILLRPGVELDRHALERLVGLGVKSMWIVHPSLETVIRCVSERVIDEQVRLASTLSNGFQAITDSIHAELEFTRYASIVRTLIGRLMIDSDAAVYVTEMNDHDQPLLAHACNVCMLSLLMGLRLDSYLVAQRTRVASHRAMHVENLGIAGLLHDIGMMYLPPDVRREWEETLDEHDPGWQEHVHLGYQRVSGRIAPTAAAAVLHHHQRWDGSGFPEREDPEAEPRPLSGDRIHVFARIVGVADVFSRTRNPPAAEKYDRPILPNVAVLNQIVEQTRMGLFDPTILCALLAVVPPYAPGTTVTLSDGTDCVVLSWDPTRPCRPVVLPLEELEHAEDAAHAIAASIDLQHHVRLDVVKAEGVICADDNFEPRDEDEFDLRACPRTNGRKSKDAA